jgi:hypothetical protein
MRGFFPGSLFGGQRDARRRAEGAAGGNGSEPCAGIVEAGASCPWVIGIEVCDPMPSITPRHGLPVLQGPRGRRRPVTGLLDVIASRIGGCSPREAAWLRQVEMKTLDRDRCCRPRSTALTAASQKGATAPILERPGTGNADVIAFIS